jgi:ketosteroid isomerase-like protein
MDKLSAVERGYEAVAAGDRGALQELFTDDATWQLMDRTEVVRKFEGREAVVDFLLQFRELRLEAIMEVRGVVVAAHSFTSRSGTRAFATTLYEFSEVACGGGICSDLRR